MNAASPVLELARALIARPSITPDDAGCLELLGARLAALGFQLERLDRGPVSNLWARWTPQTHDASVALPLLCFAGHTDVVPPGAPADWRSDPFQPEIRDGMLYGRGAADMKSSLAAFVVAVERRLARHPEPAGSIALLLTSDEEGAAVDGTAHVVDVLKARGERIDWCLVGEPTSVAQLGDTIKNGRRGSLSGHLVISGIQGHVAYPQLARNPVHQAVPALAELVAEEWDRGNAHFPPTSFQIAAIQAGSGADNVIPGRLEVRCNFRFATASTVAQLQDRVHAILDRHGLEYALHWNCGGQPYLTPPGHLSNALQAAIHGVTGRTAELSTSGGTSDGRYIAGICGEVVEFGPINASIHKTDECIAIADLEPLARCYEALLDRLPGRQNEP
ncbi:N-succinyl-diaminopimelate deacylase [Sterolibacterium denitrificans]|uniref:Succinyl-diaminopimelate desuccinylase n=1 Tax=Sterolibacterium denitrificans TaxID=157592 RepID=A0A7Z7MVH2_9PROT|nr:succinyl-diaminopimelate desuccinylase [Sterolibacterium denitrificans]SMB27521.1 N-succinyl-diaminopimelate deacylase [Sterolibacterium denitrificans]